MGFFPRFFPVFSAGQSSRRSWPLEKNTFKNKQVCFFFVPPVFFFPLVFPPLVLHVCCFFFCFFFPWCFFFCFVLFPLLPAFFRFGCFPPGVFFVQIQKVESRPAAVNWSCCFPVLCMFPFGVEKDEPGAMPTVVLFWNQLEACEAKRKLFFR